jgi:3-oxoacyl-[acyl-carrier protein] reductase
MEQNLGNRGGRKAMDLEMAQRVAWVTGGSSGIGYAGAKALAAEGALVAISARDPDRLTDAASRIETETGTRCTAVPLDVKDVDGISDAARRVTETLGPIDILVSNAGGPPPGAFSEMTDEDLNDALRLTTASAWRLAATVVPSMKERNRGCLIFITSSSTKEVIDGLLLSNTARAAVTGMNKTLSRELGPHGIRCICIAPGRVATDRSAALDKRAAELAGITPAEARAKREARIPLGRFAHPDELGSVIAFAASEKASYLTGVNLLVDGGDSTTVSA